MQAPANADHSLAVGGPCVSNAARASRNVPLHESETMNPVSIRSKALLFALVIAVAGCGELFSREDFVSRVKDKSTAEVQKEIGKPDAIDESVPGTLRWTYEGKTFHTEGGTKRDKKTVVVFRQGDAGAPAKVADVVYE